VDVDDPARPTAFGGPLRLGPAFGTASVVTGLAFAPDGDSIAIASSDETADLGPRRRHAGPRICATGAHNLTEPAWRESIRNKPYPSAPCG
jgi:hypothetical protein